MAADKLKGLIILGSILSVVGFILLFFSVNFGTLLADNWMFKQGGADNSVYLIVIRGYINNFLAAGSILLGVGISSIYIFYYKLFNIKKTI